MCEPIPREGLYKPNRKFQVWQLGEERYENGMQFMAWFVLKKFMRLESAGWFYKNITACLWEALVKYLSVAYRTVITILGIYGFVLSKSSIESQRYQSMQARDRMRKANAGEYQLTDDSRFSR